VPFWSVSTKSFPDLLTQPLMVVWSDDGVAVEDGAAPLWSEGAGDEALGLVPWSVLGVEPGAVPPLWANVMPAVINRMLVK
jgi:hypothetical protein